MLGSSCLETLKLRQGWPNSSGDDTALLPKSIVKEFNLIGPPQPLENGRRNYAMAALTPILLQNSDLIEL